MARKSNTITHTCTRTGFSVTGTPDEIAEHFYRDKSQKSGFSPWSKVAEKEYNKAYSASLQKAKVTRKGDADDKGRATFDASMKRMGARTSRARASATSKSRGNASTSKARASAKTRTVTRKRARAAKKVNGK